MPISRAGTWNKGFTLIELSLIILLIGVILVFTLPKLENIGDTKLRSSVRQLAGTIQSVFDESILKKQPYQIVFDITNRSYFITEFSDEESSEVVEIAKRVNLPDKIFIKDIVTLTEGRITDGTVTIRFYPDGYVEKNIIHISNEKKDYTLTTTPLTGKVKVIEGYVEISEE